jgi:hypothetical protein
VIDGLRFEGIRSSEVSNKEPVVSILGMGVFHASALSVEIGVLNAAIIPSLIATESS